MNKNFENYKNTFSALQPSDEAIERAMNMTKDNKKYKLKLTYKRLAAAALALLLFIGGGIGIELFTKDDSTDNGNAFVSNVKEDKNSFVMSVYAAEGEPKSLNEIDELTLPTIKINRYYDENGLSVEGSSESLFSVSGKDIDSVRYQCKISEFMIFDSSLQRYLEQQGKYYDIIVPYTDEYKKLGNAADYSQIMSIMFDHIKKGDYDKYFTRAEKKDMSCYKLAEFIYDENDIDDEGNEKIIGVGLLSNETYELVSPDYDSKTDELKSIKDYTFKNYLNETEHFAQNYWMPDYDRVLKLDKNDSYDKLPHDTVTITVTFKDGSVQKKCYDLSFNEKGELVIKSI